jgi:hypothetical protein
LLETTSKDREVAASHHGDAPYSGKTVTSVPVTPYTTSVDVNLSDFWVAAAAAAPVIALAAIVTIGDLSKFVDSPAVGRPWSGSRTEAIAALDRRGTRYVLRLAWITGINVVVQALALAFALISLVDGQSLLPAGFVIAAETIGVLLLLWAVWQDSRIRQVTTDPKWLRQIVRYQAQIEAEARAPDPSPAEATGGRGTLRARIWASFRVWPGA